MANSVGTRLKDKVAIVTGSASGIGRQIALIYASQGAYVVCSDLNPNPKTAPPDHGGKPTHEAINSAYPVPSEGAKGPQRSTFVKVDVAAATEVENLVKECVKTFGRLDIMVNNAGISHQVVHESCRLHEAPEASWDKVVGINGKGVWLGCKYAITQMLAQEPHSSGDRGWVINTASIYGVVGAPKASTYCAAKGAVTNFTRGAALEYGADRIHVNALAPGYVETPLLDGVYDPQSEDAGLKAQSEFIRSLHPFDNRLARPLDIARAALFLASEDASFVTGHVLAVDGGYLAH